MTAKLLEQAGEAGKAIRRVISHKGLELGDVIYASVQRHFNQVSSEPIPKIAKFYSDFLASELQKIAPF